MKDDTPKNKLNPSLEAAGGLLARARKEFGSRRARQAVSLAYRACDLAVGELHRASGVHLGLASGGAAPADESPDNLAAFYQAFRRFKKRLDGDERTLLNVEEAANWIRRSGMFLDSLRELIQNPNARQSEGWK